MKTASSLLLSDDSPMAAGTLPAETLTLLHTCAGDPYKDYSPFGTWTCYGIVGPTSCRCPDNMRCDVRALNAPTRGGHKNTPFFSDAGFDGERLYDPNLNPYPQP